MTPLDGGVVGQLLVVDHLGVAWGDTEQGCTPLQFLLPDRPPPIVIAWKQRVTRHAAGLYWHVAGALVHGDRQSA